jgi:hypothetical protein
MNDSDLQAAYGEVLRHRSTGRGKCPSPEAIRALIERRGSEIERLATLDHVMNCLGCKAEFDLMQTLASSNPPPVRRWPVPLTAAASVALLFSAAVLFMATRGRSGRVDALRGGVTAVELLTPRGDAAGRPLTFVWHSAKAPARYSLEVFNAAGDAIWATEVNDTAVVMPEDTPLVVGETYHWWVLVRTSDGLEARSQPVRFKP